MLGRNIEHGIAPDIVLARTNANIPTASGTDTAAKESHSTSTTLVASMNIDGSIAMRKLVSINVTNLNFGGGNEDFGSRHAAI